MVNNEEQPLGQEREVINISVCDNTSQILQRHYCMDNQGNFDHNIGDIILKKGDYTNTYITVKTTGIPNGVILSLVDENSEQLYSPVDTNNNWITTACSITVGESDIIPLPAQFDAQLSSHIPFSAGIYNWKLKFSGNDYYEEKELPLNVEIRNFKVWDIITPEIFPNDDIKVRIKTYADTYYPFPNGTIEIDNHLPSISEYLTQGIGVLTAHATYDNSTGIITYPNQDITDLSIGKHMQVINQNSNCFIDYEVKNPIEFYYYGDDKYGSDRNIGYITKATSLVSDRITPITNITINGTTIPWNYYGGNTSPRTVYNRYTNKNYFPPGTYHCVVNAPIATNQQQYTCEGNFEVSTENCSIILSVDESNNIVATYLYNDTTPIPNATIYIKELDNNSIVYNGTTNSNGQVQIPYANGRYQAIVKDATTNEDILFSEIISLNDPFLNNINMSDDGELLVTYGHEAAVDSIAINNNGDLILTLDSGVNNIITNVTIDENGELYYERK